MLCFFFKHLSTGSVRLRGAKTYIPLFFTLNEHKLLENLYRACSKQQRFLTALRQCDAFQCSEHVE
jgi:hypothetical protein